MMSGGADGPDYVTEDDDEVVSVEDEEAVEDVFDEYEMLTKVTDTTAAQARRGKDVQGIPWNSLNITRDDYRQTRLQHYKNYENVASSGEEADKMYKQMEKGGNYYEFRHNARMVKPSVLHFQLRNLVWATSKHDVYLMSNYSVIHWSSISCNVSEILNFSGHVAPTEVRNRKLADSISTKGATKLPCHTHQTPSWERRLLEHCPYLHPPQAHISIICSSTHRGSPSH